MSDEEINKIEESKPKEDKDGLVILESGRKQADWERIKLSFFLSPYKQARTFLVQENYFTNKELKNGNVVKAISGWEIERKDWETQALEITMQNLRETKAVEMKNFLVDESKIVGQLLNMTKIAMNNLIIKSKDKQTGKDVLNLTNTSGFKQVAESTINILKYSRERLGINFDNEDAGINNAVNFNFDLVNLDDFDPKQVINLFKKKDEQSGNAKSTKTDSISPISAPIKG